MRLKEIGVRKTLGGSLLHIVYLLSHKQLTLVVIAFCITAPIANILMQKWLSTFVYDISISVLLLGMGLFILLVITIITIAYQTLKAAKVNPAIILKYE
jgi:putative ABC transport system permease protein